MGRKKIQLAKKITQGETPSRKFVISPEDIVQWRYEMIREATLSRNAIEQVSKEFGYSREMYFYYKDKFLRHGILGLADDKPGPKKPQKRTKEVEKRILEIRFKTPFLNMYEIAEKLKVEGYDISARSVARTLREHGVVLKKTKGKFQKGYF